MPIRYSCSECRTALPVPSKIDPRPSDVINYNNGHCPNCKKPLELNADKITIRPVVSERKQS
jgi:hypothetical protein